jgi:putative membrane protein
MANGSTSRDLGSGACWLAALAMFRAGRAYAHEASLSALSTRFTWNPWLAFALTISAALYVRGYLRLRQRTGQTRPSDRLELLAFASSWLVLLIALVSPLDALSDALFSAHMGQHELLMVVAAPLFVLARPLHRYLWALPTGVRQRSVAWLARAQSRHGLRALTIPFFALGLHAAVRWVWHLPLLFEAALASEWVHGVQHATFFFSALVFWWALLQGRYGRMGYGVSVLFVFATAMHTGALGVLLSLAREPWYPSYQRQAEIYANDPLVDQQLAGFIMWVGVGFLFTLFGLALFAAWLGEAARRSARHGRHVPRASSNATHAAARSRDRVNVDDD